MTTTPKLPNVSASQLDRYAKLIYDKVGIHVSAQKVTLLSNRLRRRLRATHLDNYDDYYNLLRSVPPDDPEWDAFLQEVTTHETYLFRDQNHWEWMRDTFIPRVLAEHRAGQRRPTLRIWSAACSTGDEAATIACCLAHCFALAPWNIDVLGTDIGVGAVAQASRMEFGDRAMRLVPPITRKAFFDRSAENGAWSPRARIREMLRFRVHNLLEPLKESPFDLIMLKNVLIYFDVESKRRVLANVRRALLPRGVLITGAAEGVSDLICGMRSTQGWLHEAPV